MKQSKATKGIWILEGSNIINPKCDSKLGDIREIAKCYTGFDVERTKEECLANAKLISASPELLSVCQFIEFSLPSISGIPPHVIEQLKKALEKAI